MKLDISKFFVQNTDQNEVVRKSIVFIVLRVLGLILGYIFTILITRNYGARVYGYIALSLSIFMVISVVGKLGWDINLTRLVASEKHEKRDLHGLLYKLLIRSFYFSSFLALMIILNRDYIAREVFKEPGLTDYLLWASASFPLWSIILIVTGFFRGFRLNGLFAFFNSLGRYLLSVMVLLVFILAGFTDGVFAMKAHFYGTLSLVIGALFALIKMGYLPNVWTSNVDFRCFVRQSNWVLLSSFVFILMSWADRIILGVFRPAIEVGTYDVVAKLALLIGMNLDAINSILAPKISQFYYSSRRVELQELVQFACRISSAISIISYVILLSLGDIILGIIGEEYVGNVYMLAIFGAGHVMSCMFGSAGTILQMTGYQRDYLTVITLALVCNLVLSFLLVNDLGAIGLAIATATSMFVWNIAGALFVRYRLGIQSFLTIPRFR